MTHPSPAPRAPIPAELLAAVKAARPHITDASLVADIDEAVEAGDRRALWRALDRRQTAWRGATRSMRATQELALVAHPDVSDLRGAADRVRRGIEAP